MQQALCSTRAVKVLNIFPEPFLRPDPHQALTHSKKYLSSLLVGLRAASDLDAVTKGAHRGRRLGLGCGGGEEDGLFLARGDLLEKLRLVVVRAKGAA